MVDKYKNIRNVAIIAHVDHGKTTLVNELLTQSHTLAEAEDRVMDSGDIEKKRGITILSKCASIIWKDTKINIVDTPGHMDFGSEVDRILGTGLVDGALLIVDALEGIMPQTKTVLRRAVNNDLSIIIVINKIDRPGSQPEKVADNVLELLYQYSNESDHVLETPIVYAIGKDGVASMDSPEDVGNKDNLHDLLNTIVDKIPAPASLNDSPVRASVSMLDYSTYTGKIVIGKVFAGQLNKKDKLIVMNENSEVLEKFEITKLMQFTGINREEVNTINSGDIFVLCGSEVAHVNHTIASNINVIPVPIAAIQEPMLSVAIAPNKSIFAGKEGERGKLNSRQIADRLHHESYSNLGIRIELHGDETELFGRGELQLGILFEQMRQEGFEFTISSARIITKKIDGQVHEPVEEITCVIQSKHLGKVIPKLIRRGASEVERIIEDDGRLRITLEITTRNLFGYYNEFISDTSGGGQLTRRFLRYQQESGQKSIFMENGLLISTSDGSSTLYDMDKLRSRGHFIISSGIQVCKDMVVGISRTPGNVFINIARGKKLTNMRASGKDDKAGNLHVQTLTMEDIFLYLSLGCVIEVTPSSIRAHYKSTK